MEYLAGYYGNALKSHIRKYTPSPIWDVCDV